ncbi:TlpA family protein disulfide reductase [Hymenobacter nivis]|uniref:TlpA family protein disulfide reductase n=1 Tax=Hymenobacter nivis TaxID=1850093 RepID=A0A2Z3GQR7_9BACT|nr:TlpA disulfide reductase family protein [Hymenobacter nivis]AWM31724.1 TlpA family protein disulfide reductase [Hymenobacter nivis]
MAFFQRHRANLTQGLLWGSLAVVFFTDLKAPVVGTLQRGLLATGLWRPTLPAARPARAGAPRQLPDAPLYTLDGRPTNLRRFAGKVVVMNLWASWCPPCRAEMPALQHLYSQVDTTRVAFVMVSLDEKPDRARRVVEQAGYTFPVFFPAAPLPKVFDTKSIPTTFVLGPDGTVAVRREGMADYDTAEFRAYLQQLAGQ